MNSTVVQKTRFCLIFLLQLKTTLIKSSSIEWCFADPANFFKGIATREVLDYITIKLILISIYTRIQP